MTFRLRVAMLGRVALLMAAVHGASALAATSAGSLDPTFGTAGKATFNPTPLSDQAYGNALQADGKLVVGGNAARGDGNYSFSVVRFLDDGSPDPSFGVGGLATMAVGQNGGAGFFSTAVDSTGKIYVTGASTQNGLYTCTTISLLPNGQPNPAFGSGGVVRFSLNAGKTS